MDPYDLPLPIELREKIYRIFIGNHTLDKDVQKRLKVVSILMWMKKMENGLKGGQPAIEMYRMRNFIQDMIIDNQFHEREIQNMTSALRYNFSFRDRDTYQWNFQSKIINGNTCEKFLEKLKRKAKQFNFYVMYNMIRVHHYSTITSSIEEVDAVKGLIVFDRDVSNKIVRATVSSSIVFPLLEVTYQKECRDGVFFFPYELGNRELGKTIILIPKHLMQKYWSWVDQRSDG